MKRLDRYVLREMIVPFLIGTLAVVLMFDINLLMALQKDLNLANVPRQAVFQELLYKTPFFLNMTLPVGTSLAASLAISRLARESEITAMRSAGARILRIVFPVVAFGCLIGIGDFFLVEKLMPITERKASSLERQIGVLITMPDLADNAYVRLQNYQVFIGHVERQGPERLSLRDVLLISRSSSGGTDFENGGRSDLIHADDGEYNAGQWVLRGVNVYVVQGKDITYIGKGAVAPINERISLNDLLMPPQPAEMTASQLKAEIDAAKLQHRNTQQLEVQYYVRFSVPASCVVFALIAPALAIMFARSGFAGILLSIILVFLYFNAYVISTDILGKNATLSPRLAAWLPNILFGLLGLLAIRRLE